MTPDRPTTCRPGPLERLDGRARGPSGPRCSALRGLDPGLAAAGQPVRQPLAAPARRAEAAVLLGNEITVNRASTRNALEAHTLEDSHAACCHRSGEQGIAGLHPPAGWNHRRGAQASDSEVDGALQDLADESGRDGGVRGGVQDRRRSPRRGAPGPGGSGDAGALTGPRTCRCTRCATRPRARPSR
jgi:hypothetical protein